MSRPTLPRWRVPSAAAVLAAALFLATAAAALLAEPAGQGREVVIVYNSKDEAESGKLARYYALRRNVPERQIIGLPLGKSETMSRPEFREELEQPLLRELQLRGLLRFETRTASEAGAPEREYRVPVMAAFRYLLLCRGVPVRIAADASVVEAEAESLPKHLRKNNAAVDSELALLVLDPASHRLNGVLRNPVFAATNLAAFHPTNQVTLVARLDGPSLEVARDLVDRALQAEKTGLWGRGYFDARGLTNGGYRIGDEWIIDAASVARNQGFETVLDLRPETFRASYPMPQIALYAGWYDARPSGPFSRPGVEFQPGAIAYHLYSFSAQTVRSTTSWVGTFLAQGATATVGYVDEPYLELTMNLAVFYELLLNHGFTFGEAAYGAQRALSWQTTVIGDPLYCPFARTAAAWRQDLEQRRSPQLEWAVLRELDLRLLRDEPLSVSLSWLTNQAALQHSAVLRQKFGDLLVLQNRLDQAAREYAAALKLKPSPQQRIHLQWGTARLLAVAGHPAEAIGYFDDFFREHPDYPDLLALYQEALKIARNSDRADLVRKYEHEVQVRTPPPPEQASPPK